MDFQYYKEVPQEIFNLEATELADHFKRPLLIEVEGENKNPIFLTTLLHGNETTGYYAIQRFLKENKKLKRSLVILIGNIDAAKHGERKLGDQPDYNRVWAGGSSKEHLFAAKILEFARERNAVCAVDIHNNTGKNPYYGCINKMKKSFMNLASIFSDKVIYFTEPHEVASNAFADICPAITIECGVPGEEEGIEYVKDFIGRLIDKSLEDEFLENEHQEFDIYHTIGRIKIPEDVIHDYELKAKSENDISFIKEFDLMNFENVLAGTLFAYYKNEDCRIVVIDNHDQVVTARYFQFIDNKIKTKTNLIPSMFTKNVKVAKEDCLGYLMEKLEIPY